jgi:hypothetical protein
VLLALALLAIAGLDLLRGPDSALRAGWSAVHPSRRDEVRSIIDRYKQRGPRTRGR